MAIYDKSGIQLSAAYSIESEINTAYDKDGEVVFSKQIGTTLKVMSYNVGGWYIGSGANVPTEKYQEYYDLQTGMIEDSDPDVLVIQEYLANFSTGHPAIDILQELFPYVHVKTSGTYYGRAICSKYPITDYVERTFSAEPSRYFDSCTITINGIPVTFINTHLGLTQANRDSEITQLIAYLETLDKFIACGDYNTGITPTSANTSSTAYINNVKPFIDEGFHSANFADFGFLLTCVDRVDETHYYLDNIYTSSNIAIDDAEVDETKLNDLIDDPIDHMPLIATLTI